MDRCVVRQGIKEVASGKIIGYELLFQGTKDNLYNESETTAADTISKFLMNNSTKLVDDKMMFITFTPALLFRNAPKMFEPDKVIIQIEDSLLIHPLAIPIIKKYCGEGYHFAINDFQFSPKYFSMLEYANYIRINVEGKDTDCSEKEKSSLDNIVNMAQGFGKKCIATGVNSKGAFDFATLIKADYLEGNYVAKTMVSRADKVTYMKGNYFQLVIAVSKDEPDMDEIEGIVSRDAGIAYALLKLVNSAYFALRRRTASIRQALVTLGISQLRQWVYMLGFNQEEEGNSEELLKISFMRATFAAALADRVVRCPLTKADAYMMGMFSTLEYMVDAPLEDILSEIPISPEIKDALTKVEGIGSMIYQLVLAYEKADWKLSRELMDGLELPTNMLAQLYINCVESVNEIWTGLTTDHVRKGEQRKFEKVDDGRESLADVLS